MLEHKDYLSSLNKARRKQPEAGSQAVDSDPGSCPGCGSYYFCGEIYEKAGIWGNGGPVGG